ncbi:MAG TPA: hypothetical protein PLV25_04630 [Opitutales bacterium]|nr:hypothetical protein [Opitutales bacterium]
MVNKLTQDQAAQAQLDPRVVEAPEQLGQALAQLTTTLTGLANQNISQLPQDRISALGQQLDAFNSRLHHYAETGILMHPEAALSNESLAMLEQLSELPRCEGTPKELALQQSIYSLAQAAYNDYRNSREAMLDGDGPLVMFFTADKYIEHPSHERDFVKLVLAERLGLISPGEQLPVGRHGEVVDIRLRNDQMTGTGMLAKYLELYTPNNLITKFNHTWTEALKNAISGLDEQMHPAQETRNALMRILINEDFDSCFECDDEGMPTDMTDLGTAKVLTALGLVQEQ